MALSPRLWRPRSASDAGPPLGGVARYPLAALARMRRARAAQVLRGFRGLPASLLFLCVGNLYRSPFAAGLLRARLPAELCEFISIDSAGLVHLDRPSPQGAIELAAEWGVELRGHRGAVLSPQQALRVELIVVMEVRHRQLLRDRFGRFSAGVLVLGDLDPAGSWQRDIADPQDRSREVLEGSYSRIERCVAELARVLEWNASRAAMP